jgi:hypothetical protein
MPAFAGQLEDGVKAAERGDYKTAVKFWKPLAEHGDALAQAKLGDIYCRIFVGDSPDYAEALKWSRKATEQGNALGQASLGYMYEAGRGVPKDDAEAVEWYRKAAEQGDADAQGRLANMYIGEALKWFRKSAEQGNSFAQANLVAFYSLDGSNIEDLVEAYKWCSLAAHDVQTSDSAICYRLAAKMSPAQLAEAQKWASEWKPTK